MTTREQAMQWFNEKDTYNKSELSHKYYKDSVSYNFTTLTGREIEEIWKCELLNEAFEKDGTKIRVIPTKENIYLDRLRQQYKLTKTDILGLKTHDYQAMRLFCLDTQLVSFNDIEVMESEINSSF